MTGRSGGKINQHFQGRGRGRGQHANRNTPRRGRDNKRQQQGSPKEGGNKSAPKKQKDNEEVTLPPEINREKAPVKAKSRETCRMLFS